MSFAFPLGLLLLIAIPVLILIYIIKNKYRERTVSSTYVWELSKRFLKKRNPLSSIANLLNLIVQCLAIAFLSFSLSDPSFIFPGGAENEVFILDASASMELENEDGQTRFEAAKQMIAKEAKEAANGSTFTLVVGDSNPRCVCEDIADYDIFLSFLDRIEVDYAESDLAPALALAQSLASEGKGSRFRLYSDQRVETGDGLSLVPVGDKTDNRSILSLEHSCSSLEGEAELRVEGELISYAEDESLTVDLYIDGEKAAEQEIDCLKDEATPFAFVLADPEGKYAEFSSLEARIDLDDQLSLDDSYFLFDSAPFASTSILLVSYSPFFFESAFKALNQNGIDLEVTALSPAEYSLFSGSFGFDVTIFDGYSPSELPPDGAVWLINSGATIPYSGFLVQREYTVADPGIQIGYAQNDGDPLYEQLTEDIVGREITVKTYMRYTLSSRFTTILSYDNLPFVFAGRNEYGQRQVVFNFDVHNSDFPMRADFVILLRNCLAYSNPAILSEFNYQAHDTVTFSFPDGLAEAKVTSPSGKVDYLSPVDIQEFVLEEVGAYDIEVTSALGEKKQLRLYSAFPSSESAPSSVFPGTASILLGEEREKANRIFDAILPLAIVAALFLLADWMIYGHEQF